MKRPDEIIRNDWEEACEEVKEWAETESKEEIRAKAEEHYQTLKKIKPGWDPTTSLIYFSTRDKELLNNILSAQTVKTCPKLMRLYHRIYHMPALHLKLMEHHIAPWLNLPTLGNLMSSCSFFHTSEPLETQRDAIPIGICAGQAHSLIYTRNKLLVCGNNAYGQLGLEHNNSRDKFDNTLRGVLETGESIQQVAAGGNHSLVLTSQQRLLVCGRNNAGQLGLGHTENQNKFSNALQGILQKKESVLQIAAGQEHSLVLTNRGRLLVCGNNDCGQLGLGLGNIGNRNRFVAVQMYDVLKPGETVLQIAAGLHHTLISTSHNRLLVCGSNKYNQLGLVTSGAQINFTPASTGIYSGETILQIAAGQVRSLVLTSRQRLLVCGENLYGELGLGHTKNQHFFTDALAGVLLTGESVLQVTAGKVHTLLLTNKQRLLACGDNNRSQLGLNSNDRFKHNFTETLTGVLSTGETVLQVTAGSDHTLVLTSERRLLVCGDNNQRQLGVTNYGEVRGFTNSPFEAALCEKSLPEPALMADQPSEKKDGETEQAANNCCVQ